LSGYRGTVDDTPEGRKQGPPEREVTVNMLVAYNMTRWRTACGMTQAQLGGELGGWTKGAVSAAERSWDGRRIRKFDADEIANLASIFRIPIPAMFMPPEDDGIAARYVLHGEDGPVPMGDYFGLVMTDLNWDPDTPGGAAFHRAVIAATAKYVDGEAVEHVAAAARAEMADTEQVRVELAKVRANEESLREMRSALNQFEEQNATYQDVLERALKEREP
jgi:hypothetical protein